MRGIGKVIGDAFEEGGATVIRHNTKVCDLADPAAIDAFFDCLASDAGRYITGATLMVHDGLRLPG